MVNHAQLNDLLVMSCLANTDVVHAPTPPIQLYEHKVRGLSDE